LRVAGVTNVVFIARRREWTKTSRVARNPLGKKDSEEDILY